MNFDYKFECQNQFEDKNEKLGSWSENRVSHKIGLMPNGCTATMPSAWELIILEIKQT